jgi:hypothetical protein
VLQVPVKNAADFRSLSADLVRQYLPLNERTHDGKRLPKAVLDSRTVSLLCRIFEKETR